MGGNLLHLWDLPEKRLAREDFERVQEEVVRKLRGAFCLRRIAPLRVFAEKDSFGDLDVALESFSNKSFPEPDFGAVFERVFGYRPHKNGNCYSFPVDGFQVDVLMFSDVCWNTALNYYAFESGNFMGRVADQLGLMYGHRGLYLKIPLSYFDSELPEHESREVLISRNSAEIFTLLGFDFEAHQKGFRNFDEMKEWIFKSHYFNPELFQFDSLNHINRTRNRKRPVYAQFVEDCKNQPKRENMPSKEFLRDILIIAYPHLSAEIEKIRNEIIVNKARREKFNGNLIKDLLNIEKEQLGKFIVAFKSYRAKHYDGKFENYLDLYSKEDIKLDIEFFSKMHYETIQPN